MYTSLKKTLVETHLNSYKQSCPVIRFQIKGNESSLILNDKITLNSLLFFKKHWSCQFLVLSCVSGVDYPERTHRFKVVHEILSIKFNNRFRVKAFIDELKPAGSTIKAFFSCKWHESEIWDMFGVFFKNHLNLVRLLTDYGFEGFPSRKNFPLTGYVESRYNEKEKSVIKKSMELSQEFRNFKYKTL